jgi:lipid A disaccharide synthetase
MVYDLGVSRMAKKLKQRIDELREEFIETRPDVVMALDELYDIATNKRLKSKAVKIDVIGYKNMLRKIENERVA